jgi:hypothetical protein
MSMITLEPYQLVLIILTIIYGTHLICALYYDNHNRYSDRNWHLVGNLILSAGACWQDQTYPELGVFAIRAAEALMHPKAIKKMLGWNYHRLYDELQARTNDYAKYGKPTHKPHRISSSPDEYFAS